MISIKGARTYSNFIPISINNVVRASFQHHRNLIKYCFYSHQNFYNYNYIISLINLTYTTLNIKCILSHGNNLPMIKYYFYMFKKKKKVLPFW